MWRAFLLCLAGCVPLRPASPTLPEWRTLTEEHRAQITFAKGAASEKRSLRGLIAVGRPDKLRLRALGPGGILLFDVRAVAGKIEVLYALKDPTSSVLGTVLQSMVADLEAAYDLAPRPAERKSRLLAERVVIEEPGRKVELLEFVEVNHHALPRRILMHNLAQSYEVEVRISQSHVDDPLEPGTF
jgi:hypothetical protein